MCPALSCVLWCGERSPDACILLPRTCSPVRKKWFISSPNIIVSPPFQALFVDAGYSQG